MAKILFIEDDQGFSKMVKDWLEDEQYVVDCVFEAADAIELLKSHQFDLILLDWNLPEGDGVEICRNFREQGGLTPILIITGKDRIEDKETGLDAGADDYLSKPIHLKELSARIRALLRRPRKIADEVISAKHLKLNTKTREVFVSDKKVELLPKEYAVLEFLMKNPNHVYSAEDLLDRVWQYDSESAPEVVRTNIMRLRKKIDGKSKDSSIKTIYGVGYKFEV